MWLIDIAGNRITNKNGQVVHSDIRTAYQIGLKELVNRQILLKPVFESYYTDEAYDDSQGDAWKSIQHLDTYQVKPRSK